MANLAVIYSQQGREDKAEELEVQVMEISKGEAGSRPSLHADQHGQSGSDVLE
jgi:hypothetical protein